MRKFKSKILAGFMVIMMTFPVFTGKCQTRYRIYFTDKKGVNFDPYAYFDAKAIERRNSLGISLYDESDYPVSSEYIRTISEIVDSTGFASRWLNFISVYISTGQQLEKLKNLAFIREIEKVPEVIIVLTSTESVDDSFDNDLVKLMNRQLTRMGGDLFVKNNINGKGVRIAVFDGGFPWVNTHPAFEHIRKDSRIVATYDFVKKRENVYYGNKHGAMTLACIGGKYEGKKIGHATGAEFMLAKTEVNTEPYSEEENWLAAAEWADKNGASIISSSLGYTYHRYFNYQMDGKTSLVVKAANMAARKGILVVNAAGNEGDNEWKYLNTPADGDSVLAIGGVDPETDYHMGYSSYGPTVDRRLKPNVSAYSHVVTVSKQGVNPADGTSFATPLVAGFAACVIQYNKNLKGMNLFHEIEKSGHLYPYFDYAHGYGIPQASYFIKNDSATVKKTFEFIETESRMKVVVDFGILNNTEWFGDANLLYFHIEDKDGMIKDLYVVKVEQKEVLNLDKLRFEKGDRIMVHFRGYTASVTF